MPDIFVVCLKLIHSRVLMNTAHVTDLTKQGLLF